jgi:murein DD-endopeptidase MepM/ murein hydrolase activator NlpD
MNFLKILRSPVTLLLVISTIMAAAFLLPESSDPEFRHYECQHLNTDSSASQYILPYPTGKAYRVNQANCSGHGHNNFWNHGYDFIMDIGTPVVAARDGIVEWEKDRCVDGHSDCTNLITIRHDDGTIALYSHLTKGSVQVRSGERVKAGQFIGQSGNTGNTGGLPHLHFSVHPCNQLPGIPKAGVCPSLPINFRNTSANSEGLIAGKTYAAD